jgi:hypothetical protein
MHRLTLIFARHSFRPLRWRCSASQRFPDALVEPIHYHGLVVVGSTVAPAGYKCGSQVAIDLRATAHGVSNNLVQKHNQLV